METKYNVTRFIVGKKDGSGYAVIGAETVRYDVESRTPGVGIRNRIARLLAQMAFHLWKKCEEKEVHGCTSGEVVSRKNAISSALKR